MKVTLAERYRPHDKQRAFHNSGDRFVVVAAGVRGGKTVSATVEFLRRIFLDIGDPKKGRKVEGGSGRNRVPRLLYWVVAPTFELTEYVYRYVVEFCPRQLIESISGTDRSIWLKGGALIEFKSTERPERLVGASVAGMLVDEACRCKAEAWKGSLRGRLADTQGWAIFASSPFGGKNNWLYQEIVLRAGQDGYSSYHWTTADNTAVPELIKEVEHARRTQPASWFRREYEANWDSFGGAIYEEFSDANLVKEADFRLKYGFGTREPREWRLFRRVVCGVDWGITSPGAMVVVGQLNDHEFMVLEESYAAARSILGHGTTWLSEAKRLRLRWGIQIFACDPARPDAIQDLQNNGMPCVGAFNDVYLGIRRVAEALHAADARPGLRIFDSCPNLVGELRSYQWESNRDQSGFAEVPADGQSDHAADALRYAMVELKPFSIEKRHNIPDAFKPNYGPRR